MNKLLIIMFLSTILISHSYSQNQSRTKLRQPFNYEQLTDYSRTTLNQIRFYDEYVLVEALTETWSGVNWVNVSKSTYTYDSEWNLTERKNQSWQNSSWINSSRWIYTYDSNGNRTQELLQVWYLTDWENSFRSNYTFEPGSLKDQWKEVIDQNWESGNWHNQSRFVNTFTGNGTVHHNWPFPSEWIGLIAQIEYTWENNSWKESYKQSYEYDGSDNLIEGLQQQWFNSSWTNYVRYVGEYDSNGDLLNYTHQMWLNNNWVNATSQDFTYDLNRNTTERIARTWVSYNWINDYRNTYTYLNNNMTENLLEDWLNSVWTNQTNNTFTYDSNDNLLTRKVEEWANNSWLNVLNFEHSYDTNGNLAEKIMQEWAGSFWENKFKYTYSYVQTTDVDNNLFNITEYSLEQNYPNPFNPTTKINYTIPKTSQVQIKVYDILGNEIEALVNEEKSVGEYEINFNASELPSGVYFYQLKAGEFVETGKMVLLR